MTDTAANQILSFIQRAERLIEEKAALAADLREVFAEAKSSGLDVKTLKVIIKRRAMDEAERREQEQMLETYEHAIGQLKGTPLGQSAINRATAKPEQGDGRVTAVVADGAEPETAARVNPKMVERAKAILLDQEPREDGTRRASTSYVQRMLDLGYNHAARIIEHLEQDGFVSAPNHAGARTVLASPPPKPVIQDSTGRVPGMPEPNAVTSALDSIRSMVRGPQVGAV